MFFGCDNFGLAVPKFPKTRVGLYRYYFIQLDSERLPICTKCWSELAEFTENWNEHILKSEEKQNTPSRYSC